MTDVKGEAKFNDVPEDITKDESDELFKSFDNETV